MKCSIDIDLPADVLRDWEPVAFRAPREGDDAYYDCVMKKALTCHILSMGAGIILRRRFQWPAWLRCRYLVWDADGTVSGCRDLPARTDSEWIATSAEGLELVALAYLAKAIGLGFPGGDWRKRVEINPT